MALPVFAYLATLLKTIVLLTPRDYLTVIVPKSSNRVDLRSSAELENDADLGSSGTKADTAVKGLSSTLFINLIKYFLPLIIKTFRFYASIYSCHQFQF